MKEGCERDEKGRSRTSSSRTRRSNALLMITWSSDAPLDSSHRPPPPPSYSNAYSSDESSVAQPSCEGVGSPSSLPKGWFPLNISPSERVSACQSRVKRSERTEKGLNSRHADPSDNADSPHIETGRVQHLPLLAPRPSARPASLQLGLAPRDDVLGRKVKRRAEDARRSYDPRTGALRVRVQEGRVERGRQAKVAQLDGRVRPGLAEDDVLRLDVPVGDAHRVQVLANASVGSQGSVQRIDEKGLKAHLNALQDLERKEFALCLPNVKAKSSEGRLTAARVESTTYLAHLLPSQGETLDVGEQVAARHPVFSRKTNGRTSVSHLQNGPSETEDRDREKEGDRERENDAQLQEDVIVLSVVKRAVDAVEVRVGELRAERDLVPEPSEVLLGPNLFDTHERFEFRCRQGEQGDEKGDALDS